MSVLATLRRVTGMNVKPTVYGSDKCTQRIKYICWVVAILIGLAQVAANYRAMNPDGLSYLDVGDAYLRGDWGHAVNAYWSPLYSWLLGLTLWVLRPTPYWEFTVAHLVNFVIYVCALVAFNSFLNELMRGNAQPVDHSTLADDKPLPGWMWLVLGHALFIWSSIVLIGITWATPDMGVAAVVYLIAGLLCKMRRFSSRGRYSFMLGVALGAGYLLKTAMLPIGCAFLAASLGSFDTLRRALPRMLVAATVFIIIAAPLIVALSISKGRITIGDSGKLNYSWFVNGNTLFMHWQGEQPGLGVPIHTTRKILNHPAIFEFRAPVGGTFPPWYDPSYWYEGVKLQFDLAQQTKALITGLGSFAYIFYYFRSGRLVTSLYAFLVIVCMRRAGAKSIRERLNIIVPTIFATCMYSLVVVEPRYLGAFIVLFIIGTLAGARLPAGRYAQLCLIYVMLIAPVSIVIASGCERVYRDQLEMAENAGDPHEHWRIAQSLGQYGIGPGSEVASVGYSFSPYWARLARLKIVAEMPVVEPFWADRAKHDEVIGAFMKSGAKAIIARELPPSAVQAGWERIEYTRACVYILTRSTPAD